MTDQTDEEKEQNMLFMEIKIPFPSQRLAMIAYNTLRVDREPKRGGCKKTLVVLEKELHIKLQAQEARVLRVASNALLDFVHLVLDTMDRFDPERSVEE